MVLVVSELLYQKIISFQITGLDMEIYPVFISRLCTEECQKGLLGKGKRCWASMIWGCDTSFLRSKYAYVSGAEELFSV